MHTIEKGLFLNMKLKQNKIVYLQLFVRKMGLEVAENIPSSALKKKLGREKCT